ncbi:STAS domain-containing protein [Metabacillus halosaccharovorans]|uniref:STAS domain-containing protein n=1 Tax=Metabacillus halosaccharovorans TaxID=930124 RepID=A0ABT3DC64_9BACI|nr:STAS domain-containing protein [Metabacillus halosaccharovorans]MCV9884438.1 STAS domain-containing protein [Metabacillus halosaccharovorans]
MKFKFQESYELKQFFENNIQGFEERLLAEAVNVTDKIDEILAIGNIDLVNNAKKLVTYIVDGKEKELQLFAKQEGIAWSTHSIDLTFKLEWIQAIRRTVWYFIEQYNRLTNGKIVADFFTLEKEINNSIDEFLNSFFISYSTYKDSLIKAHRKLVENLSVPIIPINSSVCILPLIGSIDDYRANILEEKVLTEIGISRIQTLIIDLSGIADMEANVIEHLLKIIHGASMMGCNSVITGLRKEVVRKVIHLGVSFDNRTETLGTLQQALTKYLVL